MSNLIDVNSNAPMVQLTGDNRLTTTSLAVAKYFNKSHDKVLRAIKNLECSKEFVAANFGGISLKDQYRRDLPAFEITRDGFMFLAMGFTGRQASLLKERYIMAFNQMEQELINRQVVEIPAFIKQALLDSNPNWEAVLRYKNIGLSNSEIAKLLDFKASSSITRILRKMESLQLIEPPKNLLEMQERGKKSAFARFEKAKTIEFITELEV